MIGITRLSQSVDRIAERLRQSRFMGVTIEGKPEFKILTVDGYYRLMYDLSRPAVFSQNGVARPESFQIEHVTESNTVGITELAKSGSRISKRLSQERRMGVTVGGKVKFVIMTIDEHSQLIDLLSRPAVVTRDGVTRPKALLMEHLAHYRGGY